MRTAHSQVQFERPRLMSEYICSENEQFQQGKITPSSRYGVTTMDPRLLLPTESNVRKVEQMIRLVLAQLDHDRQWIDGGFPVDYATYPAAVRCYEESLQYVKLLEDWLINVKDIIVTEACYKCEMIVSASNKQLPRSLECLSSETTHYVKIRPIRECLYGSVDLYQIGTRTSYDDPIQLVFPPKFVAIKTYDKARVREKRSKSGHIMQEDPIRELAVQQRLTAFSTGPTSIIPVISIMETEQKLYAVYPYGGEDMFDYISTHKKVPEKQAKVFFRRMAEAVHYCHQSGICHRDISLENFLMRAEKSNSGVSLEPALIDFGLSIQMEPRQDGTWNPSVPHSGPVGKEYYMSPEVLCNPDNENAGGDRHAFYDAIKADVWSLGVCLAVLLVGAPLWQCASSSDERFRILILEQRFGEVIREWGLDSQFSPQVINLIRRMLEYNPDERLSLEEVLNDEWFSN
jgi:serine/threonine protein kinase